MSTTSTTTSTSPHPYPYGVTRKAGLSYTASEVLSVVLPNDSLIVSTLANYSLKCFVRFGPYLGIFDGDGANRVDSGVPLVSGSAVTLTTFNTPSPQHRVSQSSTTSTTTTSTTTSTTTTSTSTTTTSTTQTTTTTV